MKIIAKSNFDKETQSEVLIAENVSETYFQKIVDFLNDKFSGEYAPLFFEAKEDDYELYTWEP